MSNVRLMLIAVLLLGVQLFGQQLIRPETEDEDPLPVEKSILDPESEFFKRNSENLFPGRQYLEQALDAAVDSNAYLVGPGDVLLLKVWGMLEAEAPLEVSSEGYVIIPSVGEIAVADLSLANASSLIKERVGKNITNSSFSVRLLRMRKFRVFLTGEVETPGTYYVRGVDRLSDALQLTGDQAKVGDESRIELRRRSGEVQVVDFSKFFGEGDLSANPLLQNGDIIYVPPIDARGDYVYIEGNLDAQGPYSLRPQETLWSALTRARVMNRQTDLSKIALLRGESRTIFNLLTDGDKTRSFLLEPGDKILVTPKLNQVFVTGEVTFPGAFDYKANHVAWDYAGFAGVTEKARSVDEIYVIRSATGEVVRGTQVVVENGDIVVVPRKRRETINDIVRIITPILSLGISLFAIITR